MLTPDDSITYTHGGRTGRSIVRFEISEPGTYEISVVGNDLNTVAAIGRQPPDGSFN